MIKKKFKIILLIALACILLAAGAICYMLYMPHRNIQREAPVITSSSGLVDAYQKNESAANALYLDKVLQVTGTISGMETNNDGQVVVTLSGPSPLSGVRCTLLEKQPIDTGNAITLKGRCTGYLSDVIVVDCLIIK